MKRSSHVSEGVMSGFMKSCNFSELAVATAIVLFGFNSGAALATVVGVLVEVPVRLSVVKLVDRTKVWYERGPRVLVLSPMTSPRIRD